MMMAPSGGEGGSGAGPSQRRGHIDLTLPPGSGDELSDLVAELDQAEREIRRLSESRIESTEDLEARQQILARLKTFLDEVDSRLEQAREIDRVRDNERARLREELDAQMAPFIQRIQAAELAAERRAKAVEVPTLLSQQIQAQEQYLKLWDEVRSEKK